jgi:hypothetical protein
VVLGEPDPDVERLLAPAAGSVTPVDVASRLARPVAPDAGPADATHLLARAVERASDRARHAPPAPAPSGPPSRERAPAVDPIGGRLPGRETAASAGIATPPGGFRGLARRAVGATGEVIPRPLGLERELRQAPEARLDDLDARVAESLARVLEREARRHGIDVTGARA